MTRIEFLAEWSSAELHWGPAEGPLLTSTSDDCDTIPCAIDISWDNDGCDGG